MGLKRREVRFIENTEIFAPCMGLKRYWLCEDMIKIVFAPCMGLKRVPGSRRRRVIEFAPCMGLKSIQFI